MNNKFREYIYEVLEEFPFLELKFWPTNQKYPVLFGYLISKYDFESQFLYRSDLTNCKYSLLVYVDIPENYLETGVEVYDYNRSIDIYRLKRDFKEYYHFNGTDISKGNLICSHHKLSVKYLRNPILENLRTSYSLFIEYKNLFKNGTFRIAQYSHGDRGTMECYNDIIQGYYKKDRRITSKIKM